jgi:hypothetical protein
MAKAAMKKTPAKRAASKPKTKGGDRYACEVCGLAVVVDETCGCAEACDIVCCGTSMKKKRARA